MKSGPWILETYYRFRLVRALFGFPVGETTWSGQNIYAAPLRPWAWVPFGTWVYWIPAMGTTVESARAAAWRSLGR